MKSAIEEIKSLRTRAYREKTQLVIVEGYPEIRQAHLAGVEFVKLYICPEIFEDSNGEFADLKIENVTKDVFAQMAFGSRLKGILAICKPRILKLVDLQFSCENPLIIVMDAVEKPGNLGAVLRSCDGAGVDALIHCNGQTDIYNQHVVRSSIGTLFTVPVVAAQEDETYDFFKKQGCQIVRTSAHADLVYTKADYSGATAILIGNEHSGLSDFWLKKADTHVTIPMNGKGQCLNAAMSASILAYEALRQRSTN